jgi:hypothetical protein
MDAERGAGPDGNFLREEFPVDFRFFPRIDEMRQGKLKTMNGPTEPHCGFRQSRFSARRWAMTQNDPEKHPGRRFDPWPAWEWWSSTRVYPGA